MERASHDLRAVITTYEGKHNHDVPAPRGSRSISTNDNNNNNNNNNNHNHNHNVAQMAIRASSTFNNNSMVNPLRNGQTPYTLEMLQSPGGYGGFSGFGNPLGPAYMNGAQAKEEPRDDAFLDSLLY